MSGVHDDLAWLDNYFRAHGSTADAWAFKRVEAELARLVEVEASFKHLSSEYHYDMDRGDHLVYAREWDAFNAWQRGDLSFEKRAEAAEARCARLEAVLRAAFNYYPKDTPMSESMADALAGLRTPADSQPEMRPEDDLLDDLLADSQPEDGTA